MAKPKQIFTEKEKKLILALYEAGKTDEQVASVLGMAKTTVIDACKYNGLTDTIKEAKEKPDDVVERSLYERANGYEHPEEKIFCNDGVIVRATTTKKYPPDPVSMIFWLKNRRPEKWREKTELKVDVTDDLAELLRKARERASTERK